MALYCNALPATSDAFWGAMVIEVRTTGAPEPAVTVKVVELVMDPACALMVVLPVVEAVARPLPLIVATDVTLEAHAADELRFCVDPSV